MLDYEIGDFNILLWSSKAYLKWFMISIIEAKFEISSFTDMRELSVNLWPGDSVVNEQRECTPCKGVRSESVV